MFITKPWILIILIIISLSILIFSGTYNNSKVLMISPYSSLTSVGYEIGYSIEENKNKKEDFICNVKNSDRICEVKFRLSENSINGVDLSSYDYISFILLTEEESFESINIYLNNYDKYNLLSEKTEILKENYIILNEDKNGSYKKIPLDNFNLKDDWILKSKKQNQKINKELNNVVSISFIINSINNNDMNIKIKDIEFNGKWFNEKEIMIFMVFKWMLVIMAYTIVFLYRENKRANILQSSSDSLKSSTQKIIEEYKRDSLTGIYNRHAFRKWLDNTDKDFKIAVIYMDLDHFKTVNDLYGHVMGDRVLCEFTQIINGLINEKEDIFCRWGGEEFLIFCKDKDLEYAKNKIKLIKDKMNSNNWSTGSKITISAGLSFGNSIDINELIEIADKKLYLAKNNGRDRFEF